MHFMPPIFHFFLILATAKGNSKLSGPDVLKLLGRKQKKDLNPLKKREITDA